MTIFKGEEVTLVGNKLTVGDKAPNFILMDNQFAVKSLKDYGRQIKVLSVVPSVDTGICDAQTRRFNQELAGLTNTVVITVSVDLPFAQARWCGAVGLEDAITLSDYYDHKFGRDYGLLMKEWNLLARAVFVLDEDNTVLYADYVDNVNSHPDYETALDLVKNHASQ